MYNSLSVILILLIILSNNNVQSYNPSHCSIYLHNQYKPSNGHYLLGIEHSIANEHVCKHRCSINNRCSTARFNQQFHRCHLFQNNQKNSLYLPYRSINIHSKSTDCSAKSSLSSNIKQLQGSNDHCTYDTYVLK